MVAGFFTVSRFIHPPSQLHTTLINLLSPTNTNMAKRETVKQSGMHGKLKTPMAGTIVGGSGRKTPKR